MPFLFVQKTRQFFFCEAFFTFLEESGQFEVAVSMEVLSTYVTLVLKFLDCFELLDSPEMVNVLSSPVDKPSVYSHPDLLDLTIIVVFLNPLKPERSQGFYFVSCVDCTLDQISGSHCSRPYYNRPPIPVSDLVGKLTQGVFEAQ